MIPRGPRGSELPPLGVDAGLCAGCRHARILRSARSAFLRCLRAATDRRFPRYPSLPVSSCSGWEPVAEGEPSAPEPPGGRSS